MRMEKSNVWPLIYGLGVVVLLSLFIYSLWPELSPVVLFLALMILLRPYAGTQQYRLTVITVTLLLFIWMLRTTGFLLAPFILALVISYILDPAVDALEARRVPRSIGIALLMLPVIGLVLIGLVFGIPALADQMEALIGQAPRFLDRVAAWLGGLTEGVAGLDLPFVREEVLLQRLQAPDADEIILFLERQWEGIGERTWRAVLGLGQGLGTAVTILGYVVLTPVLTYYLLRDYDRITVRLVELMPRGRRTDWLAFAREYNDLLSRYLRGQLIVATVVGVLTGVGLWITGFPFAGLVGAVAGVFNLVPYLGLIVSLIPALVIAFLSGSVLVSLLKVAGVFLVVQLIDSTVLGPRIVGGSVGLHPVWVLLALALSSFFFGFVGLLLAVPAAVLIKLLGRLALERYERSGVYRTEGDGAEDHA